MRTRYARARSYGPGLTAPKVATFWIAVVVGLFGMLLNYHVITIAALSPHAFLLLAGAFVLLAVACLARGL